jgi:hypothetical protein
MSLKKFENCKLRPDKEQNVIETEIAFFWMEDDILHYVAKRVVRTPENVKTVFDAIHKLTKGEKVCALAEMNDMLQYKDVPREQSVKSLEKYFKAVAIVSCTPLGKMMSNVGIVRNFNGSVKVFTDPLEAKEWLNKFK